MLYSFYERDDIMARTTFISKCRSFEYAKPIILNTLAREGFSFVLENNEKVWKCGNGHWVSMKYLKFEFVNNTTVHITGWVKSTIGPEQNLDGVIGGLPKKQLLKIIKEIQAAIQ